MTAAHACICSGYLIYLSNFVGSGVRINPTAKKQAKGLTAAHPARKATPAAAMGERDPGAVAYTPAAADGTLTRLGRQQSASSAWGDPSPGPSECSNVLSGIPCKSRRSDSKATEVIERLKQILATDDVGLTTNCQIVNRLVAELGEEVRNYKPLIKVCCLVCLSIQACSANVLLVTGCIKLNTLKISSCVGTVHTI